MKVRGMAAAKLWGLHEVRGHVHLQLHLQRPPFVLLKGVTATRFGTRALRHCRFPHQSSTTGSFYLFNPHKTSNQICHDSTGIVRPAYLDADEGAVPTPIVLIDQDSDPNATIVEVSFGDRLGALIDTMKALRDLGLDVVKGSVLTEASVVRTKFFITRLTAGRKIENPEVLEQIRLTIINNLLQYHPESSENLAMGEAFGIKPPTKKLDIDVATHIHIEDDGPKRSMLYLETADRPGLLMEVIKIMADTNVTVESAEIDTEGLVAKDKFHVSYQGAALRSSMAEVLTNCLRYYLRRPETEEDSY